MGIASIALCLSTWEKIGLTKGTNFGIFLRSRDGYALRSAGKTGLWAGYQASCYSFGILYFIFLSPLFLSFTSCYEAWRTLGYGLMAWPNWLSGAALVAVFANDIRRGFFFLPWAGILVETRTGCYFLALGRVLCVQV